VKLLWRNPETRNDLLKWQEQSAFWSMVQNAARSVPIVIALQRAGLPQDEIDAIVNTPEFKALEQQKADMAQAASGFGRTGG